LARQIRNNRIRLDIYKEQLKRFECISDDGSQIYKLLHLFFNYDILYIIPIEYISDLLKEFYKTKYGTAILNKKKQKRKKKKEKKTKMKIIMWIKKKMIMRMKTRLKMMKKKMSRKYLRNN
jgi:hypothetical protein